MFDIAGTMLLVYWLAVYGLKSIWVPWVWPVFNQIFLMVYLSPWLRRSNVMTGAGWQITLMATPVFLVLRDFSSLLICCGVLLLTTTILKFNWWDKLEANYSGETQELKL